MESFFEIFYDVVKLHPEKIALADDTESITYSRLDELSGRGCGYLKSKDIGRECFVQIVLKRKVSIPVTMLGVLKAEAAPHDACYAVYTSGSTGNPKGVLHEYGNLMQACNSFDDRYDKTISTSAILSAAVWEYISMSCYSSG